MHGSVIFDDRDDVGGPRCSGAISGPRTNAARSRDTVGAARLIEWVSNPALTGFTLPKLLWVRSARARAVGACDRCCLPKDYVRFRLTGERATDVADASGTLMFDVARRKWSSEILKAMDVEARPAAARLRVAGDDRRAVGGGRARPGCARDAGGGGAAAIKRRARSAWASCSPAW